LIAWLVLGCDDGASADRAEKRAEKSMPLTLSAAGATFPYPVYARWFSTYGESAGVRITYRSVGSDSGLRLVRDRTVDLGAVDEPLGARTERDGADDGLVAIPTVVGAVAVAYNLPSLTAPLRVDGSWLADVFLGRVRQWDTPRLRALNPGVALPSIDIQPGYRHDRSGTTYVASRFLAAASPRWRSDAAGTARDTGLAGTGSRGNEGVAGFVKQTVGAIAFVELTYAMQQRIPVAAVRNASGRFIRPTVASTRAAADSALSGSSDDGALESLLVNAPGPDAYPIAALTYLLVAEQQPDARRASAIAAFLRWTLRSGSADALAMQYAPVPASLHRRIEARIARISAPVQP